MSLTSITLLYNEYRRFTVVIHPVYGHRQTKWRSQSDQKTHNTDLKHVTMNKMRAKMAI